MAAFIAVKKNASLHGKVPRASCLVPGDGVPGRTAPSVEPHLGFLHAAANPERENRGDDADEEHRAPAETRQHDRDDDGGNAVADGPAALHDAERLAAVLLGPGLADEGGAAGPFPAHAKAEEDAEYGELPDVLGEAAREGKDRIEQDAEDRARVRPSWSARTPNTRPPTAEARQGQGGQQTARLTRQPEVLTDGREDESVEHHVEGVEHPTQRRRYQSLPSLRISLLPETKYVDIKFCSHGL